MQQGPLVVSPKGTDVHLTCAINYSPEAAEESSSHVLWTRDNKLVNYDASGRWFVWTEKLINDSLFASSFTPSSPSVATSSSSSVSSGLLSHLLIKSADSSDSGNYSCQLHAPTIDSSYSHPAHVQVHVLNGKENPAAIYGSGAGGSGIKLNSIANSGTLVLIKTWMGIPYCFVFLRTLLFLSTF